MNDYLFPCGARVSDMDKLSFHQKFILCRKDMALFSWYVFPHHIIIENGIPQFHLDFYEMWMKKHRQMVIIEPRGFAKTTRSSLVIPAHEIIYNAVKYILIMSESQDLAGDNIQTFKDECETNERFIAFYNYVYGKDPMPKRKYSGEGVFKWTQKDLILANGERLRSLGTGMRVRGRKYKQYRPDLEIVEDPESGNNTKTPESRARNLKWLNSEVLPSLADNGRILAQGNFVEIDCMLENLYKSSQMAIEDSEYKWVGVKNSAYIDEARTKSLWKERFPVERLRNIEADLNSRGDYVTFEREYMNNPMPDSEKRFDPMKYRFWNGRPMVSNMGSWIRITKYGKYASKFATEPTYEDGFEDVFPCSYSMSLDPAFTENTKNDANNISVIGETNIGEIFQCESTYFHTKDIDYIIDRMMEYILIYFPQSVSVEAVQAQALIIPPLQRRINKEKATYPMLANVHVVPAEESNNRENKEIRILTLKDKFNQFILYLREGLKQCEREITLFPGTHDDGPDALERAIRFSKRPGNTGYEAGSRNTTQSYYPNLGISWKVA